MKTNPHEKEPKDAANDFITRKELASLFHAMASICKTDELVQSPSSSAIPVSLKPEFIRVNEAVKLFGIGRGKLYEMMGAGKIKSVSLRERGSIRGTRLISYDHLKSYLENLLE